MYFRIASGALAVFCLGIVAGAATPARIPAYVAAAVADPNRPQADTTRDANRKPAEDVAFAGVRPGDKVVDLDPGPFYFTRILSKVVGPKGWVYAYVPSDLNELYKKYNVVIVPPADPHYPNVSYINAPIAKFLVPETVDVVWTSDNYHDFHNKTYGPADVSAMNKAIYGALKPGGTYIVLDHIAEKGSGLRDTETLHRIDPAEVKKEILAAGFVFAGESRVLQNPADDHTKKVFDKSIRGQTDQFIFKFKKPRK